MRQINYVELFVDGKQIQAESKTVTLKLHQTGNLVSPTGKIVACDPLTSPETPPFTVSIPPKEYPVILSIADYGDDQRVAFAMLKFSDEKPARWEMALLPNQNIAALKKDEVFCYGVDSATGCFMDVEAAQILVDGQDDDTYFDLIAGELDKTYVYTWSWANICLNQKTKANIVCFSTGFGDGAYASYFGLSRSGNALCLVTDFRVFADEELKESLI